MSVYVWRRLAARFIRLGIWKGVALRTSLFRLKNHGPMIQMMEKVCYSFGSPLCIFIPYKQTKVSVLLLAVASHADYAIMLCI